ncbi:MAG: ribosome-binding factor A [Patescibacteria group bacterium]
MDSRRQTQVSQVIAQLAADFFVRESPVKALITVTHADISPTYKEVTVFISVLPHTMEMQALKFAKRARTDFRAYIKSQSRLHPIPVVDFEIDLGEKNRQRIDELTRN